jgi:hypothetical protein
MKTLCLTTLTLLLLQSGAQPPQMETFQPPALNVVETATLSPNYGCRSKDEFAKGYRKTALFLSELVRRYNSPDLLFNGACGGEDDFYARTHGGNTSTITDLGPNVPLENVWSPAAAAGARAEGDGPRADKSAPVKVGHTYVVRLDKPRRARGWYVFTVTRHEPNKLVEIRYAVREYQLVHEGIPPAARPEDDDDPPPPQ